MFFLGHRVHFCNKERKRKRGNSISLLFIHFETGQWLEGTRTTPAEPTTAKSTSAEKRTNAADCRVPFFPSFLPSLQLLLLPSFVRSPARSSVRPSSSFSLFLSLHFIRRFLAFHSKKAGTRWEPGPGFSRIWNNVHTISVRGTPGRVVWNNFLNDLTTGRCGLLRTIRHSIIFA